MHSHTTKSFDSKHFLQTLGSHPGVYRMLNEKEQVIYVGKANNLKKRISSYFSKAHNNKTLALVNHIHQIEITVTSSEGEALLLENTLIKKYQPRYNILLRDDKSYPYIYISTHQEYPRVSVYRGSTRNKPGTFFGPYPAAGSVRRTVHLLHKIFKIRQCNDSYFKNRSRPCLQYQIKRCSAPCVNLVSKKTYEQSIKHAVLFLKGKTQAILDALIIDMQSASDRHEFEQAAEYRDQINHLRIIFEKQHVSGTAGRNIDILACYKQENQCCMQVFYFRDGMNQGNKAFFPKIPEKYMDESTILDAFMSQYYLAHEIPDEVIVSHAPSSIALLTDVLSEKAGKQIEIKAHVRSERARWLENARQNAHEALNLHMATKSSHQKQLLAVQELFQLETIPQRMECFDISHTQGSETVASCVVFDSQGACKSDYRRYNIKDVTPGDDYAALGQALERRYTKVLKDDGVLPDILFIDGGKGQLSKAMEITHSLLPDNCLLVGISKGAGRKAGMELLHIAGKKHPKEANSNPSASLLIQRIRDEAHRFALTGHRQRARKKHIHSVLEDIEGLGPKRRQLLLQSFGGIHGIKRAGINDLKNIRGISQNLATRIYEQLHIHSG